MNIYIHKQYMILQPDLEDIFNFTFIFSIVYIILLILYIYAIENKID
jgi:hypothetical protein